MLEVFNRNPLPMDAEWLDFLETLAGQAAIAINQMQLFEDLQRANFELIAAYDATDEWDAVTIDRPYRAGWTKESAIQYIREQSAKHFDPRVVEVFLKIIA